MVAASTHPPDVERIAYSPAEFAAAVGCTREHIHNLIRRGELPSVKLGRKRLIHRSVLDAMFEEADADGAA